MSFGVVLQADQGGSHKISKPRLLGWLGLTKADYCCGARRSSFLPRLISGFVIATSYIWDLVWESRNSAASSGAVVPYSDPDIGVVQLTLQRKRLTYCIHSDHPGWVA